MSGEVVYQSHSVAIPPESVDKIFISQVAELIKRVAAAQEASAYPSEYECKFCDIQDCKYRFGQLPTEVEPQPLVVDATVVDSIDVRPGTISRIEGDVDDALRDLVQPLPLGTFASDTPFDGVIYDIEIERGIADGPEENDILYCKGWEDYPNMSISTLCAYDYVEDAYRVFCRDNFEEFLDLLSKRKWIVGFNNLKFDNHVLEEYVAANFPSTDSKDLAVGVRARTYDILVEIWRTEGLREIFKIRTHGGYGLDAVCKATFGIRKTGNGAHAPVDWQRGKRGTVIDYCLNDIRLTKRVMDSILAREPLVNPKRGGDLILRHPED